MDEIEERLRERVIDGARKRWNDAEMDSFAAQRLEFELSMINKGGWADYFLMVADVVEAARGAGGIVGPGRGRAVASVVLYALGVTGINPFKHENILFERFLPSEIAKNASLICVDFDGIGYAAALSYLKSNYGDIKAEERKCHAAPECWHVGERCIGVTHLEALDRIAFTTKLIAETGGTVPDIEHLPEDETSAMQVLCRGDTADIPGFDTPSARRWIRRLRPNDVSELAIIHALHPPYREEKLIEYEEGACNSQPSAIFRLTSSREYLNETRGVVAYDEQVMLLLRRLGGFTRDEAYKCRKALACKMSERIAGFKEKFISGLVGNEELCKIEELSANEAHGLAGRIWAELEHDAMFTSLKAHDIAQVRLAYLSAYLKHNYPMEWMFADGEISGMPTVRKVRGQITLRDIEHALTVYDMRVIMLVRHAERPPLDPSDTTFGARLPITEKGMTDALTFGGALAHFVHAGDAAVLASETLRTVQTAHVIHRCFVRQEELPSSEVRRCGYLGGKSPFFGSLDERMKLIAEGRYLERLNEYFRVGTQLGYRPLASAADEFEDWLIETSRLSGQPLTIAVTHDINVASFLASRGVVTSFTNETWPHYLDAAVIMLDGHGYAEYGFLKHVDCGEG